MARIIVTDSTAYLPENIVDQYNIRVIPLNVHIDGVAYREGLDMYNRAYFKMLRSRPIFPTTSPPAPVDFFNIYESLDDGDEAVVVTISSRLSKTFETAMQARDLIKKPNVKIAIQDSLMSSSAQALQVLQAIELTEAGCTLDEVMAELEQTKKRQHFYFIVDNLEYLARGGRIGHWSKRIGNFLDFKPLIAFNQGRLELKQNTRNRKKAMEIILNVMDGVRPRPRHIAITHVDSWGDLETFERKLLISGVEPILRTETGPVIGSHLGPGSLGIAFY